MANSSRRKSGRSAALAPKPAGQVLRWHDLRRPGRTAPIQVAGLAWFERERVFRRLPLGSGKVIPKEVDQLANHTAGAQARFQSDSRQVAVRVRLSKAPQMGHMAATGAAGFDLYLGPPGKPRGLRFYDSTVFNPAKKEYEIVLFKHPRRQWRNITLNFPLYSGVERVEVGLEPGARVRPPPAWALSRPVVVYGTSITQGGCASRPGMLPTNLLSRWLNLEFINLGFSGNGRGEPEVARAMAGIPRPRMLVLEYETNAGPEGLRRTLPEFIRILRQAHPSVPLLVISRVRFSLEIQQPQHRRIRVRTLEFQRQIVRRLRRAGDRKIYFWSGGDLLGRDFEECTVDGLHPTDLGFYRIAQGLRPVFRRLLGLKR